MRRLFLLLALVPAIWLGAPTVAGAADPPQSTWLTVLLGGRKIGHIHIERQRQGDALTTTQTLMVDFTRSGKPLRLENMSRSMETLDGRPLGFGSLNRFSALDSTVDGRRAADGRYRVVTTVGGRSRPSLIDWPQGALLAEGQRLAAVAAGRRAGDSYRLHGFDPATQRGFAMQVDILGDETVTLPRGPERLSHQRQTLLLGHGSQVMDLWLDDQGVARKGLMYMIGQPLEMLACDQACALAPNQGFDMFSAAIVQSPRLLPRAYRDQPLRYRVRVTDGAGQAFITTDEQQVRPLGGGSWQIDVGGSHAGRQAPPTPNDSTPTAWLQSDAPAIVRLAVEATRGAKNDRTRMRRLRAFVSGYITQHGLDVGYASALEVVGNRQGDCTEYAVLLAALARAQGIPARVVSGMVYAERFVGSARVFVPHEWVQAWVDGRWQSYDAALGYFDAGHLALASGDGDPWYFANATRLFGNVRIDQIVPGNDLAPTIAPAPGPPPAAGGQSGH